MPRRPAAAPQGVTLVRLGPPPMHSAAVPPPKPPAATGDAPAWAQVLDKDALDRLRELDPQGKTGLLQRVMTTYAQSLGRLLDQLVTARATADMQGLRHVAHTLKSSSASVGALQLSALCADIERRVREGTGEGLDARLDAMAQEGRRILAALNTPTPPTA